MSSGSRCWEQCKTEFDSFPTRQANDATLELLKCMGHNDTGRLHPVNGIILHRITA